VSKKKSGFIAIIGRPNTGKSTLVNKLCGRKIAIVSHVPQTTRNTIKGIYTKDNAQLVFLDTPGIHESAKAYNKVLNQQASHAIGEADAVLYMVDLSRSIGQEEHAIVEMLKSTKKPVVIAYNKVDIKDNKVAKNSFEYKKLFEDVEKKGEHFISALKGMHTEELVEDLVDLLPEGEFFYPEGMYSDQTLDFMVSEMIRERIMLNVKEEVPHSVRVEVTGMDEETNEKILAIYADIYVERDSQKGIMIGKGGQKLKKIGMEARKNLEKEFNKKIYLELSVKVDPSWRTSQG